MSGTPATPPVPGGFGRDTPPSPYSEDVPKNLRAATSRLQFPPSYVVVGFYRLVSDSKLRVPAWQKCKHGFVRGATVGIIWVSILLKLVSPKWYMLGEYGALPWVVCSFNKGSGNIQDPEGFR